MFTEEPPRADLVWSDLDEPVGDISDNLALGLGLDGNDLEDLSGGVRWLHADHGEKGRRREVWGPAMGILNID
jgi:hypothetical protein